MTRFFERGTALAEMERQMMMVPNFTPRSNGSAVLCRYRSAAADVDCQSCVRRRRQSCRSLKCLHLTERLRAGTASVAELAAETVQPWKHLRLKQRAMLIAGQMKAFHFEGQLHVMRMFEMTKGEGENIGSQWLAAVYLLSARAPLWQNTFAAVMPGRIDFDRVRLRDATVQDYVLYRAAKGICSRTLQLLEDVDIGDVLRRDCHVIELDSRYPIPKCLESKVVNVDELDYLAKRLESFCKSEGGQFQAMAHKLDLSDITDLINLTFCCQQATVIADFSDLEAVGRAHYMNIHGGCAVDRELANLDGHETALLLIDSGAGVVTPYGVVYDNGMKLEQLYDGRYFPSYLYGPSVMAVEARSDGGAAGCFCLPMPARQLQRIQERAGLENPDIPLKDVMDELPEETSNALDLDRLTLGDLADLNRLCQIIGTLKSPDDRKKMDAVVCAAHPDRIDRIQMLAENLELFDFVPGVHSPEEYGRYMIQQSGRFEYDENLAETIDGMNEAGHYQLCKALTTSSRQGLDCILQTAAHIGRSSMDRYEVIPGVKDHRELERWLVEHDHLAAEVPGFLRPHLDYRSIGISYCNAHEGEFLVNGYTGMRTGIAVLCGY